MSETTIEIDLDLDLEKGVLKFVFMSVCSILLLLSELVFQNM